MSCQKVLKNPFFFLTGASPEKATEIICCKYLVTHSSVTLSNGKSLIQKTGSLFNWSIRRSIRKEGYNYSVPPPVAPAHRGRLPQGRLLCLAQAAAEPASVTALEDTFLSRSLARVWDALRYSWDFKTGHYSLLQLFFCSSNLATWLGKFHATFHFKDFCPILLKTTTTKIA